MAELELIHEADMILDACGRPQAPPGYRYVDLPRVLNFVVEVTSSPNGGPGTPPMPFSRMVQNKSDTLFICTGVGMNYGPQFRIKWPSGRYLSQQPAGNPGLSGPCFPAGLGSFQLALNAEEPIERGGRVTIEVFGPDTGILRVALWGKLRYLLRESADGNPANNQVACIVGYPAEARPVPRDRAAHLVQVIPEPLEVLKARPRYVCGPNQNVMAPEIMLGNQCCAEFPDGFEAEPFNLLSDPIEVDVNENTTGVPVLMPGSDDMWVRRIRATVLDFEDNVGPSTRMVYALRHPSGYSVTGGDLIPFVYNWLPLFPMLKTRSGDRLILDLGTIDGTGLGPGDRTITVQFEFDCVKLRRAA